VVDKRKSKTKRTPAKKPRASPGSGAQDGVVDEWGNQWNRCMPLSEETLSEVETQLRINIPADLRKLFLSCNGGRPEKTYFGTRQIEVGIGSVLPIRPPASHKGSSFEATYQRMNRSGLPSKLLPFAYDTGNAGIFCLDAESGEIVYWVHNDPEYPIKKVTTSLTNFLSNLDLPPY